MNPALIVQTAAAAGSSRLHPQAHTRERAASALSHALTHERMCVPCFHRVQAAEAIALLLLPNNTSLDKLLAVAKMTPAIMHLALAHPLCSTLHTRALRLMRSSLASRVPELAMQMMVSGWSCGLNDPLLAPGGKKGNCRPLPELLAAAGALDVVAG